MKKSKKKILLFILILLIFIFLCGYIYFNYFLTIEVKEISLLQQKFTIESQIYLIPSENSDPESEIKPQSTEDVQKGTQSSGKQSSTKQNSSKTSTNKNYNSGYSTGSGSSAYVGTGSYTPKIQIPRTGIKCTIYSEMTVKNMEKGVVILSTDEGLNYPGNTVISGHNTVNGKLFSRNDKIQVGDLIYITDSDGDKLTYLVYEKYYTDPNDASYIDRDTEGRREISLTTCTNDSSQRIIILAAEIL